MICPRCGFQSGYDFQSCPNCADPALAVVIDPDEDRPTKLSEVMAEPITGVLTRTPFDAISDFGIPCGAAVLVSGPAGCGKSTWALRIASVWPNMSWYAPYERGAEALKRDADRLGIDAENIWVCDVESPVHRYAGPGSLLVIDSLNEFATKMDYGLLASARVLSDLASRSGTTVVMIGHVTKEWEVLGSERIKHAVDVLVEIEPEFSVAGKMGFDTIAEPQRIFCNQKNRYGPMWEIVTAPPWT